MIISTKLFYCCSCAEAYCKLLLILLILICFYVIYTVDIFLSFTSEFITIHTKYQTKWHLQQ